MLSSQAYRSMWRSTRVAQDIVTRHLSKITPLYLNMPRQLQQDGLSSADAAATGVQILTDDEEDSVTLRTSAESHRAITPPSVRTGPDQGPVEDQLTMGYSHMLMLETFKVQTVTVRGLA
eukprot:scaffold1163_cov362-Prasinococcus_capsulatus_cf.AAC.16